MIDIETPQFTRDLDLLDPDAFLVSAQGEAWLQSLTAQWPFVRYAYDPAAKRTLRDCNAIAQAILQSKYPPQAPLETYGGMDPVDLWDNDVWPHISSALIEASAKRDDAMLDRWHDAVWPRWEEQANDADQSSFADQFGSHDRCELVVHFAPGRSLEDALIWSRRSWPDFGEIIPCPELVIALNQLGYTLGEYRKASRNRTLSHQPMNGCSRRRRAPLVTMDQLREAVNNACSTSFMIILFAVVPLSDLLALDVTRSMTLDRSWVATLDPINGTFHDVPAHGPVTLTAKDVQLISGAALAWSPDEICGLHTPHYHATIRN
jgi:hypothetical protein